MCATIEPCPIRIIVTGERRAIAAYHSVLVFNVLGVAGLGDEETPVEMPAEPEQPLIDLQETYRSVTARNLLESYTRRAAGARPGSQSFSLGLPSARAALSRGKSLLVPFAGKVLKMARDLDYLPEELEGLRSHALADTYFCNFSLFQSTAR